MVCKTPFGFPVDPEVYKIKSGSSALITSGSHSASASTIASCHQISREASKLTSSPVRSTTTTFSIDGHSATAASAFAFIGISLRGPRIAVSCVISILHAESLILSRRDSAENAPKTIEWIAPILAHANIAIANSGTICR